MRCVKLQEFFLSAKISLMIANPNFIPAKRNFWRGRVDEPISPLTTRWHQIVTFPPNHDLRAFTDKEQRGFAFVGFASDTGIVRNLGRAGSKQGPEVLRQALSNLPVHSSSLRLLDCGDVVCLGDNLEEAQKNLGDVVAKILAAGLTPIVLGGGHEVAFGHYLGLKQELKKFKNKKPRLGIINFDAHFDMRPISNGSTSGTPFLQIAEDMQASGLPFSYLCLGIQKSTNTAQLFETAKKWRANFILAEDVHLANFKKLSATLKSFLSRHDKIYLTFCLDVLAAPFAPGVSSPSPAGILPDVALALVKLIAESGKILNFDVAELSPPFDQDGRTAKMAAKVVFEVVEGILGK